MTPERASEILNTESQVMPGCKLIEVGTVRNILTDDEHHEVMDVWETMPGHTSYFNALQRIANGEVND